MSGHRNIHHGPVHLLSSLDQWPYFYLNVIDKIYLDARLLNHAHWPSYSEFSPSLSSVLLAYVFNYPSFREVTRVTSRYLVEAAFSHRWQCGCCVLLWGLPQDAFVALKVLSALPTPPLPSLPPETTNLFAASTVQSFTEIYIAGLTQYIHIHFR